MKSETSQSSNCTNWVNSFREFRSAIYAHDKAKASKFVDFPILDVGNEIWYLAYGYDERISQLPNTIKPFTEQDFHKYFDNLFSKRFINAILKIKSEELYKKGMFGIGEFQEGDDTTYGIDGTFNKEECSLQLQLLSNTVVRDENGQVQDGGESSITYEFAVKSGEIKLVQIWLAG